MINERGSLVAVWSRGRGSLVTFILLRVVQAILTILGASILVWGLLRLAPGDPALRTLKAMGIENPRPAEVAAVRTELKLDSSVVAQYFNWLSRALRGDLGNSYQSRESVSREIARRLPATALLTGLALLISIVISVLLATMAVAFYEQLPDRLVGLLTQAGAACPSFLLCLLALYVIVLGRGWGHVVSELSWNDVWLPAFCLSIGKASEWTQLLRANLLEAMGAHYTMVAAARGATRLRTLVLYALPNALLPFLTVIGVGIGSLIGGAPIVEAVFSYPGVGSYVVAGVTARDLPVVQGFVVISTLAYVTASCLVDVSSALIDPRLRHPKEAA
jgi:ABC-type dipeptide/oligopeptide/nickel transport system permease component